MHACRSTLEDPTPCGECPQCLEIASGTSPDDVLEIDGASNRGIDQIRELRDTIKYAPARSRHRIYIIDEAHQITDAGFNALLKTLEEPPPHAVFMMATTEAQKIPATILSRCQRFQLKPIPPLQTQGQLRKIIKQEKLKVDDDALLEVARAAHGSLRDALSLLDQVIAFSPDGVTGKDIRSLLGLLPQELVRAFAETLLEGSPEKVLQAVQSAVEEGFDLFQLAQDLQDHWHQVLLWKGGVKDERRPDVEELKKNAARYVLPQLERNLQIITRASEQMRRSESPRVTFELAALELAQKGLSVDEVLDRLEALEKSLEGGAPPPVKKNPDLSFASGGSVPLAPSGLTATSPARADRPNSSQSSSDRPAENALAGSPAIRKSLAGTPPPLAGSQAPIPTSSDAPLLRPDQVRAAWMLMLEEVGKKKPSLEPFLLGARWDVQPGNALNIVCSQEFQKQQLLAHLPLISEALRRNLACAFTVQCLLGEAPPAPSAPGPEAPASAADDSNDEAEVVDDRADSPGDEEPEEAPAAAGPAPAPVPATSDRLATRDTPADLANMDPGLKKILDKFPGKLKKIEPAL